MEKISHKNERFLITVKDKEKIEENFYNEAVRSDMEDSINAKVKTDAEESTQVLEGRNAVIEAFRSGKDIDKIFVLDGCGDGPIRTVIREAKKQDTIINFVDKRRLDQLSETGKHQGVIAYISSYNYSSVESILELAKSKDEEPFILFLDGIEDPHNLGAIIRTANIVGAHGVVIPKRRAAGLTATVARTSAGALNYTPVGKVTNLTKTIEELKTKGMWFVCGHMDGEIMYNLNLKGPIGLVVGNEGAGVSRLVKESCDLIARIPMRGEIESLNASVAAGVLAYEILRQRM
jgi:23S rRNA (guanosine2251-2'-O)-methyltransferase